MHHYLPTPGPHTFVIGFITVQFIHLLTLYALNTVSMQSFIYDPHPDLSSKSSADTIRSSGYRLSDAYKLKVLKWDDILAYLHYFNSPAVIFVSLL